MPRKAPARKTPKTTKTKVVTNRNSVFGTLLKQKWLAAAFAGIFMLVGAATIWWVSAATTTASLWSTSTVPKVITDSDTKSVELGTKFRSANPGKVLGMRFYKGPQNTGTHTGSLWTNNGTKLASVTFANETASGWQTAYFSKPIDITANTTYVVSYHAPKGRYSANNDYFKRAYTNGSLTAPKNAGVYRYGASGFPTDSYRGSNYWVDVIVSSSRFDPTPKPEAPSNLVAKVSGTSVNLTWTNSPTAGIIRHDIYRDGKVIASSNTGTYTDTTTTAGKSYSYYIAAVDSTTVASSPSNTVQITIPAAPTPTPDPTPTPTPTPDPTPTPTPNPTPSACAPYPSFPDAACTGTSGTLTRYTGSTSFTTPGQVIQNVEIYADGVYVGADNVTFRNVKFVYTGPLDGSFTFINVPAGTEGTVFDRCEIDGQNKIARAIKGYQAVTVRNCNIHHTANAVEVATNFTVEESYLHDIATANGMDWHADGIQSAETVSNITVRHNTILLTGNETGAINIIGAASDTISNVLIENNLMAGGGYTVYAGAGKVSNYRIVNNKFSTRYYTKVGQYGIWYPTFLSGVAVSGNTILETGAPTNP